MTDPPFVLAGQELVTKLEVVVTVPSEVAPLEEQEDETTVALKVAVTLLAALMVTVHVLDVPLQAPPQPANISEPVAAAVNVTLAPELKLEEHVLPQLMPAGLLVTVPDPVPPLLTVRM